MNTTTASQLFLYANSNAAFTTGGETGINNGSHRVLLRRETGQGIIYHGSATTLARLELIAAEFKLENWKAAVDLHYEFGEAADALFDDD